MMSVILETSLGDITIDLFAQEAPRSCENFLKLCKIKYYNYAPIHTVQRNFTLQTGDPIGPGSPDSDGGTSIWGILDGGSKSSRKNFVPEFSSKLKHTERGTVSMATAPSARDSEIREAASQFIITLGDETSFLDGRAAPFGRVVEGFDVLEAINTAFIDEAGRPLKDIRIRHTIILDEADIPDPAGLVEPPTSPVPTKMQLATVRIADDEDLDPNADEETVSRLRREREARAQALTLEMVGDLPFAEVAPPENVLFVCKLNPVTRDEDLELIFSRFGKILSCEVIRDKKTGDSLQYAFIEFSEKASAEQAYFKMQSVLIDDCRIHVDFSQSVSKLADVWRDGANAKRGARRGGWGGIEGLEKKRQYRAYDDRGDKERRSKYGMVFDDRDKEKRGISSGTHKRSGNGSDRRDKRSDGGRREDEEHGYRRRSTSRTRSRSPRRRRSRSRDDERYQRPRQRNDSRERYIDRDYRHKR